MVDFPELKLSEHFVARLNKLQAFKLSCWQKFRKLSVNDKQKLLFKLPIPGIKEHEDSPSTHNSSHSTTNSGLGDSRITNSDSIVNIKTGVFQIDDENFEFEYSSYEHLNQLSTPIWEKNQLDKQKFVSRYVQPYLDDENVDYESLYNERQIDKLLLFFQDAIEFTNTERTVEDALKTSVYNAIQKPLLYSVGKFRSDVKGELSDHLKRTGRDMESSMFPLMAHLSTHGDSHLKYLGVSVRPDDCIGYYSTHNHTVVASLVGIVKVKTPSFQLNRSYKKLVSSSPDLSLNTDNFEGDKLVLELQDAIQEYTTMCLHTGCDLDC